MEKWPALAWPTVVPFCGSTKVVDLKILAKQKSGSLNLEVCLCLVYSDWLSRALGYGLSHCFPPENLYLDMLWIEHVILSRPSNILPSTSSSIMYLLYIVDNIFKVPMKILCLQKIIYCIQGQSQCLQASDCAVRINVYYMLISHGGI